jgi:hypothetical protein
VLAQKVDRPFGCTSRNPLPPELLKEKFLNCALSVLPESNSTQLYGMIQGFEKIKDVRELTVLTAPRPKNTARPAVVARA